MTIELNRNLSLLNLTGAEVLESLLVQHENQSFTAQAFSIEENKIPSFLLEHANSKPISSPTIIPQVYLQNQHVQVLSNEKLVVNGSNEKLLAEIIGTLVQNLNIPVISALIDLSKGDFNLFKFVLGQILPVDVFKAIEVLGKILKLADELGLFDAKTWENGFNQSKELFDQLLQAVDGLDFSHAYKLLNQVKDIVHDLIIKSPNIIALNEDATYQESASNHQKNTTKQEDQKVIFLDLLNNDELNIQISKFDVKNYELNKTIFQDSDLHSLDQFNVVLQTLENII